MSQQPKYLLIKNKLLEEIHSGKFKPGDRFYTESELKTKFSVSSITVLRAVNELVQERYLTRIQGKGTFLKKDAPKRDVKFTELLHSPNGHTEKMVRNGAEKTIILSITEITDERIAKELKVSADEKIVHFKRVRRVGSVLWSLQNNYIPLKYLPKLDLNDSESFESVADMIQRNYGIDLINARMEENISVEFPAPEFVKYLLSIEGNEPVYNFKRKTYVEGEIPFEYIETYVRWDYYSIEISK